MKSRYAAKTAVPINRSQEEIRKILGKYGADGFAFAELKESAMIAFELSGKQIRFKLPMPAKPNVDAPQVRFKEWEQTCKSKWRALALSIKAKLECVACGITTLEEEFLAHIMLPNGKTVGEITMEQIEHSYKNGKMPLLLGMK